MSAVNSPLEPLRARMPTVSLTLARFIPADRDDWLGTALTVLATGEREQIDARPDSDGRAQHAIGRALLRLLWAQASGRPPAEAEIAVSDDGKPTLPGGLEISVAHTGTVVVVAACAAARVGVDIEPPPANADRCRRLTERRFSEPEKAALRELPDAAAGEWFARAWTIKEAVGKALGTGVIPALAGAVVSVGADALISVWTGPPAASWTLHQLPAPGGHEWITVAIPAPDVALGTVTQLTLADFTEAAAGSDG